MSDYQRLVDYKNKLDAVSHSFCLAKWQQVTLHLQTGLTHSCHHPTPHFIPVNEILRNPSALHNTSWKKEQRKLMLNQRRPPECEYCWKAEDAGAISDRVYKSMEPWADPYFDEVKNAPWDANVNPSYLEVSFSSACNFKCTYCGPQFSSLWMQEIQEFGHYPTSTAYNNINELKLQNAMPIPAKEHNPYVEAFWEWWPDVYPGLKHFRITGGEPFLSKDTFQAIDYIIENPNPELDFSINSNMCIPESIFSRFIEKAKILCSEKKVKKFMVFTSCDTQGKHAEYIRTGLDYNVWLANIRRLLTEVPQATVVVMSTYNFLSLLDYRHFLEDMLEIKKEFGGAGKDIPLIIDIPYLRQPYFLSVFLAPSRVSEVIEKQITYMYANREDPNWPPLTNRGFYQFEIDKLKRVHDLIKNNNINSIQVHHKDFIAFIEENDRRRGTNFLETFPKLAPTIDFWKNNDIGTPML